MREEWFNKDNKTWSYLSAAFAVIFLCIGIFTISYLIIISLLLFMMASIIAMDDRLQRLEDEGAER